MLFKRPAAALMTAVLSACASTAPEPRGARASGALLVDVYPNPVLARQIDGEIYEFPFEVSFRETGGVEIEIEAVRVEVRLRGVPIFTQLFDDTELTRRGYSTSIPAASNVQYRFAPRRAVPTDILFTHVSAHVAVLGRDRLGNRVEAGTTVTVHRQTNTPK